ncbi:MAG: helix-turn-helix domain-containing protein [Porphyromonas sp.]|mgnify:CR=1 FL=1|uniref:helix-turn-helix domain-containing protein n=1 Tax=Porphyromonas sp. TaxID=1924944 RepID=UPI001CACCD79|nr:helix-turn-helix domain-containing protein [Porphyromonas sp.]
MSITNLTTEQRQNNVTLSIDRVKEALAKAHNTHPSNWLTAKEACELLGISRPTLLAGRKKGKYTYVMHNGTRVYYDRRSLEEYLQPVDIL